MGPALPEGPPPTGPTPHSDGSDERWLWLREPGGPPGAGGAWPGLCRVPAMVETVRGSAYLAPA